MPHNPFNSRSTLRTSAGEFVWYDLGALERAGLARIERMPYSVRILLESVLRNVDGFIVTQDDVAGLAGYDASKVEPVEMPFMPGRVVLQDFTGVPCVVDLAAMRDAMKRLGGDPALINPAVQCDLVIDHSVQVDDFATRVALTINAQKEFERNNERYRFLKWGQESLANFRVVPPATGIVHQVNLEYLAKGVLTRTQDDGATAVYPDSLVGTDSHTTMINGLGVLGWGVGGIEAEAVMLGQPVYMLTPEVIGFKLTGRLPEGATATDLVLTVTQMLREYGVVEKFVEFFGPGMAELSIPDRATIANMAPEYGATVGFFPVDRKTLDYLRFTGRDEATVELVDKYCKANRMFWTPDSPDPVFTAVLELDLSTVQPSLAGPRRPQDRVPLASMKAQWHKDLVDTFGKKSRGQSVNLNEWAGEGGQTKGAPVNSENAAQGHNHGEHGVRVKLTEASRPERPGQEITLGHGSVVIAAITSCTNTSNPDVMIAAALVARKARALGLTRKPWVKTSLAPGSKVVTEYFDKANLTEDLNALGFHTVGYGCTTCIGNSGPLPPEIEEAAKQGDLVVASVLSGNRNFEGRVHPAVRANYLASPPLVVAYAIAGTVDIDLTHEPLARTPDGRDVFLRDLWPTHAEVQAVKAACLTPEQFRSRYGAVFTGNDTWNKVPVSTSELYPWDEKSTYVQNPPFFEGMSESTPGVTHIRRARVLAYLGDSVTTDHISPAGSIAENSPAGQYLLSLGVRKPDFNSYGARRGNDRVMTRGTFANVRVRNRIAAAQDGTIPEGGWTRDFTRGATLADAPVCWIFDAAERYKAKNIPLVVLAGKDYGMGSSRDWAAKGAYLLGVRAVIAESFERIHRSNLVFMGVLPLVFKDGQSAASLSLRGDELFDIHLPDPIDPRCDVPVTATRPDGSVVSFTCRCRIDTPIEADYYRNGGILQTVIRKKLNEARAGAGV
ncbi:MAG TPA: aconitate hydratase AcnA [Phycisphaerales bacterium]|nr:aconitate hydratase AcnA [Phycisphaerales bacterium]